MSTPALYTVSAGAQQKLSGRPGRALQPEE